MIQKARRAPLSHPTSNHVWLPGMIVCLIASNHPNEEDLNGVESLNIPLNPIIKSQYPARNIPLEMRIAIAEKRGFLLRMLKIIRAPMQSILAHI